MNIFKKIQTGLKWIWVNHLHIWVDSGKTLSHIPNQVILKKNIKNVSIILKPDLFRSMNTFKSNQLL